MAFSATKTGETVFGDRRVTWGTFSQGDGDTGGDVVTGLRRKVECFQATACLNVSVSGTTATMTTADPGAVQAGHWMAFGY